MCQVEATQLCVLNGMLQFLILKLNNLAALGADLVVMRITIVAFLVLGGISKLMFDNQAGIDK